MANQIIPTNSLIKEGGAYFSRNARISTDNNGISFGYSRSAYRTASSSPSSKLFGFKGFNNAIVAKEAVTTTVDDTNKILFMRNNIGELWVADWTNGDVFKMAPCLNGTTAAYYGITNGMAYDVDGYICYTDTQYIHRVFNVTLADSVNTTQDTININDGTLFGSTGTNYALICTFGHFEVISYTGKSTNQLTGVTRGLFGTSGYAHLSGSRIYGIQKNFQDFGAQDTTSTRSLFKWEDVLLGANGNIVSGYKETGGTDFASLLTLSSEWSIVDYGELLTSATSYIIIGLNCGDKGMIVLWDGKDTQPINQIVIDEKITCIERNFIATTHNIYSYSAGILTPLLYEPDSKNYASFAGNLNINTIKIKDERYLIFGNSDNLPSLSQDFSRRNGGLYIYDMVRGELTFVSAPNNASFSTIENMIQVGTSFCLGTSYGGGCIELLSLSPNSENIYRTIWAPQNSKSLKLKKVWLNISTDTLNYYNNKDYNFDIILRYYDFKSPFIQYTTLKSGGNPATANIIYTTTGTGVPAVGDRVEIVNGQKTTHTGIGEPRSVESVLAGVDQYAITVTEDFSSVVGTASHNDGLVVVINPLKEIGKKTFSGKTFDDNKISFPILSQPTFRKIMFEIEARCSNVEIAPQIDSIEIEYEQLTI